MLKAPSGAVVLAASGALGLLVGFFYADWQWAVEHAQVLAGLVAYPPDSPVAIAHAKIWSLTSQIGAVLLSLGVSEIGLSKVLSGVMGLLSFQALAAIVYSLGRDAVLATGSVFVILVSGVFNYGPVYPIDLLGTAHTHGAIGLSVAALAVGLLGMGWHRAGGFVLAVAPAVHLALGTWAIAIVALAMAVSGADGRRAIRAVWPAFAGGAVVAALSYGVQRWLVPPIPPIDPAEAERYLRAFVPFWDGHRQPVNLGSYGVRLVAGATIITLLAHRVFRAGLTPDARLLLRVIAVGGALGLGLAAWTSVSPNTMPDALVLTMPGRMLNLVVFIAGAMLIGLAGAHWARLGSQIVLLFLTAGLVVSSHSRLWEVAGGRPWRLDPLAVATIAAVVLLVLAWRARVVSTAQGPASRGVRIAIVATLCVAAGAATIDAVRAYAARAEIFRDRTNDPVFAAAATGTGPLLTAGELFLVQARTRRAVLLDGGTLDTLPYALEQGPAMDRILRDVYGVDLFNPPPEARGGGRVPHEFSRRVWEAYSVEKWRQIAGTYGVTQVLAPADWAVSLPRTEASSGLALYAIPR